MSKCIAALFAALAVLLAGPALAQTPTKIWDMPFGLPIAELPTNVFTMPACGSNGGPPGRELKGFADFAACRPEASGLREIWFIHDDTEEYMARARRDDARVARYQATVIGTQPAILSFLVDEAGLIRGYRIWTDPRAPETLRVDAYTAANLMRSRYGTGWACADQPAADGEQPIEGTFIKRHCERDVPGGHAVVDSHYYYKEGQGLIDPATGKPTSNLFESRASIEVLQTGDLATPAVLPPIVAVTPEVLPPGSEMARAFLAGETQHCPGCDLSGADLRWRDLSGTNLSGALLEAALLHRAKLRGADLSGAILQRADLNLTDLTSANLTGADLKDAMLYGVTGGRADFTDATLDGAMLGSARLTLANFTRVKARTTDFGDARLGDAVFAGALLEGSNLSNTTLLRADFSNAEGKGIYFAGAILKGANLTGAKFGLSDMAGADLVDANLSNADLSDVRFTRANLRGARQDGTIFTGSLMPDNTTAP